MSLATGPLLTGCGASQDQPLPLGELAEYQSCDVASDCTIVENGCCCSMIAIDRDRFADFRERFTCDTACECNPPHQLVECREHLCTLITTGDPP